MLLRSTRSSALLQSKGFSLLEVMVAIAIMAVAVVAMFQLYSRALLSTKKAEDITKAVFYARSMLDEAYAMADLADASDTKEFDRYFKVRREVVVKSESKDGKSRLYEITVSVGWPPSGSMTLKGLRSVNTPE